MNYDRYNIKKNEVTWRFRKRSEQEFQLLAIISQHQKIYHKTFYMENKPSVILERIHLNLGKVVLSNFFEYKYGLNKNQKFIKDACNA